MHLQDMEQMFLRADTTGSGELSLGDFKSVIMRKLATSRRGSIARASLTMSADAHHRSRCVGLSRAVRCCVCSADAPSDRSSWLVEGLTSLLSLFVYGTKYIT